MATINIRNIPGDIAEALRKLALADNRSREAYIRLMLVKHVESKRKWERKEKPRGEA